MICDYALVQLSASPALLRKAVSSLRLQTPGVTNHSLTHVLGAIKHHCPCRHLEISSAQGSSFPTKVFYKSGEMVQCVKWARNPEFWSQAPSEAGSGDKWTSGHTGGQTSPMTKLQDQWEMGSPKLMWMVTTEGTWGWVLVTHTHTCTQLSENII